MPTVPPTALPIAAPSREPSPPAEPPALPGPRGPLSAAVLDALRGAPAVPVDAGSAEPYGEDLQLALYCCYELHYRGFAGVADDREWDPELLGLRRALEQRFLAALRRDVPGRGIDADVEAAIAGLLVEPADAWGVSHHLRRDGELWQLREYVALRSLYHLKEADPQALVIARLSGPAKAALVSVEHDEYGAGDPDRMHAHLFAAMMQELGLDARYGAYLDHAPAEVLAEVNLMSLCGLHRALRGALVGQFATVELTSSPGSDRLVRAIRRLGGGPAASEFYAEHVEADAVHEQLVRRGVIAPLLAAEPALAADIVFGIEASNLLADRLSALLLDHWARDRSVLRHPLPARA
ncbi:iron-containing redox enzyme family protein [Pseudonocardia bannensis]|uniref:Iron-containing redox enzyme family protein n=1 Tax=Pseudonocardia bannensis TaxID=630973 RepID=A0A848DI77_9PSEU|nr:iron-containing redox enzyme family protein [Pseudonocardia bannensis]NMH92256.1 iron-containing redox enzyme family protein [Pseudonocardia bannensis]